MKAIFRSTSTGLDHAFVACELTQILGEDLVVMLNAHLPTGSRQLAISPTGD